MSAPLSITCFGNLAARIWRAAGKLVSDSGSDRSLHYLPCNVFRLAWRTFCRYTLFRDMINHESPDRTGMKCMLIWCWCTMPIRTLLRGVWVNPHYPTPPDYLVVSGSACKAPARPRTHPSCHVAPDRAPGLCGCGCCCRIATPRQPTRSPKSRSFIYPGDLRRGLPLVSRTVPRCNWHL